MFANYEKITPSEFDNRFPDATFIVYNELGDEVHEYLNAKDAINGFPFEYTEDDYLAIDTNDNDYVADFINGKLVILQTEHEAE